MDAVCPADIEEITHKTGNSKKFAVFLKMLQAALQQQGESVFLDILTYADLQALKSRKAGSANGLPASTGAMSSRNQKRYLILTHASQFDRCVSSHWARCRHRLACTASDERPALPLVRRVHYPLPLSPECAPSSDGGVLQTGNPYRAAHGTSDGHVVEPTHRQFDELLREKVRTDPLTHCARAKRSSQTRVTPVRPSPDRKSVV